MIFAISAVMLSGLIGTPQYLARAWRLGEDDHLDRSSAGSTRGACSFLDSWCSRGNRDMGAVTGAGDQVALGGADGYGECAYETGSFAEGGADHCGREGREFVDQFTYSGD